MSRTRSATVESVGHEETTAERANRLRQEVAEILDLMLSPATPKVRVTTC